MEHYLVTVEQMKQALARDPDTLWYSVHVRDELVGFTTTVGSLDAPGRAVTYRALTARHLAALKTGGV